MEDAHRGTLKLEFNNREIICQPGDCRRHLSFLCFLEASHITRPSMQLFDKITTKISHMSPRIIMTIGWVRNEFRWVPTENQKTNCDLSEAIQHFATNSLRMLDFATARLAKGIAKLPPIRCFTASTILIWKQTDIDSITFHACPPMSTFNLRESFPKDWESRWLEQFLESTQAEISNAR